MIHLAHKLNPLPLKTYQWFSIFLRDTNDWALEVWLCISKIKVQRKKQAEVSKYSIVKVRASSVEHAQSWAKQVLVGAEFTLPCLNSTVTKNILNILEFRRSLVNNATTSSAWQWPESLGHNKIIILFGWIYKFSKSGSTL